MGITCGDNARVCDKNETIRRRKKNDEALKVDVDEWRTIEGTTRRLAESIWINSGILKANTLKVLLTVLMGELGKGR